MDGRSEAHRRFVESMEIDAQRWRDAVGYDLAALARCSPDEQAEIEKRLIPRAGRDWRDVQALLALDTPRALMAAHDGLASRDRVVRLFTAESLAARGEREFLEGAVIEAIENGDAGSELAIALRMSADHPSEAIRRAMVEAVLERDREPMLLTAEALFDLLGVSGARHGRYTDFFETLAPMRPDARAAALREAFAELGVEDPALDALDAPRRRRVGPVRRLLRWLVRLVCLAALGGVGWYLYALATLPDRPSDAVHAPVALTLGLGLLGIVLLLWFDGKFGRILLFLLGAAALGACALSTRWVDSSAAGVREHWAGYERQKVRLRGSLCYRIDAQAFELRGSGAARFRYERRVWPGAHDEASFRAYFFSDAQMARGADGWTCPVRR